MSKYDDLVKKLKEIFQIDRPELDFGVYRILNCRAVEINEYLENRLKAKVTESLAASGAANVESLQKELHDKEAQYRADGINPDNVPKVLEIREKLAKYGTGTAEHENAVFTHLLTFFSRYYDKGDFISQRRYKGDTYAIPYAGEEVVLHWANKNQYYTKSGENFANYGFKLDDGRTVRFRLITADTAKDNRKDNDKERRFVLIEPHTRIRTDDEGDEYEEELLPISEENGELVLRFEYKAMPKGSKQETLVIDAVKKILETLAPSGRGWGEWHFDWHAALSKREPTEKNPERTLLEKCLTNYTTKNTADYFIHKDLGGFLRRELDFYIKNEVMHLDDVQNAEKFADIEKNLRLIQTLRAIALDLITFLAQLEDFQKKLWLKKKFVVSVHYCVTLDRLPESLYPVIAGNPKQWEQWENLGMLDHEAPSQEQRNRLGMRGGAAPSPLRGEGRGEGQEEKQIKTRSKQERSEILQAFAKEMRQAPTDAEARMWHFLRNRRLGNWKFRRQHPVGQYIVDFICVEAGLVVELDGGQHNDLFAQQSDAERSAFLAERGLRVLRFWNNEVLQQTQAVLEKILLTLDESTPQLAPHPNPLPNGEREKIAYLKEHPYLTADTALFDAAFKQALLAAVDNLDESLDGLLIHGDNFHAINFLNESYRRQIACIHIDPPYNTYTSGFMYKNNYRHSSWLSLMDSRLEASLKLLAVDGHYVCHIDENEYEKLHLLFDGAGIGNAGTIVWDKRNPMNGGAGVATQHEYIIWRTDDAKPLSMPNSSVLSMIRIAKKLIDAEGGVTDSIRKRYASWLNSNTELSGGEKAYRYIDANGNIYQSVSLRAPEPRDDPKFHEPLIHPKTKKPCAVPPNGFSRTPETLKLMIERGEILFGEDETTQPRQKVVLTKNTSRQLSSLIQDAKKGKADTASMGIEFPYCHPRSMYELIVSISTKDHGFILDYFAGSGTTGHAVVDCNRKDGGKRKYILVEQGEYFDTVMKPRIQKVVYSADWKDGKPIPSTRPTPQKGEGEKAPSPLWGEGWGEGTCSGISHAFKVLKLESYEDTLNNLQLRRGEAQQNLLDRLPPPAKEDYLLRYLLDIESRGSLLSVEQFNKPFDCKLKVAVDSAGAYEERTIDLVETFNYLIGLRVKHIDMQRERGFVLVTGWLPTGEKTLVLWRDVEKVDYENLNRLCDKLAINPADSEFEVVYINGDHNIPSVFTSTEAEGSITKTLKIRQIEPEFLNRMFSVEEAS